MRMTRRLRKRRDASQMSWVSGPASPDARTIIDSIRAARLLSPAGIHRGRSAAYPARTTRCARRLVKPNTDSLRYALVYRFSAIMVAAAAVLIVLTALWIGERSAPRGTAPHAVSVAHRIQSVRPDAVMTVMRQSLSRYHRALILIGR
jgi:hypothetical protein